MRATPFVTMLIPLVFFSACSPDTDGSSGTAIYVPPTRLGGQGSVMFLPASAPSPGKIDEDILRAVLEKIGRQGACVSPVLLNPPFAALRRDLAEAGTQGRTPAGRADFVRSRIGQWSDARGAVDRTLAARITEATVAIVERDHRLPLLLAERRRADLPRLPAAWLAPGQSLGERTDCTQVTISQAATYASLAFVDVEIVFAPLAGSGERWVMEKSGNGWTVLAVQKLWIS